MGMKAVFGFLVGLISLLDYFCHLPAQYKLILGSCLTLLTIVPATISLVWALRELYDHPFSRIKYISFGLAKYFLADAFQSFIDQAALMENKESIRGGRFWHLISRILYSAPLTRSYQLIYYSYAHVVDCDNADCYNGGQGNMHDETTMRIEGAYSDAISIGGHRLCLVDMSKIPNKEHFHEKWGSQASHCLHLDVGRFEKHKIFSSPRAVEEVQKIIAWWSANPEKPVFRSFQKDRMTAHCPSLYLL